MAKSYVKIQKKRMRQMPPNTKRTAELTNVANMLMVKLLNLTKDLEKIETVYQMDPDEVRIQAEMLESMTKEISKSKHWDADGELVGDVGNGHSDQVFIDSGEISSYLCDDPDAKCRKHWIRSNEKLDKFFNHGVHHNTRG